VRIYGTLQGSQRSWACIHSSRKCFIAFEERGFTSKTHIKDFLAEDYLWDLADSKQLSLCDVHLITKNFIQTHRQLSADQRAERVAHVKDLYAKPNVGTHMAVSVVVVGLALLFWAAAPCLKSIRALEVDIARFGPCHEAQYIEHTTTTTDLQNKERLFLHIKELWVHLELGWWNALLVEHVASLLSLCVLSISMPNEVPLACSLACLNFLTLVMGFLSAVSVVNLSESFQLCSIARSTAEWSMQPAKWLLPVKSSLLQIDRDFLSSLYKFCGFSISLMMISMALLRRRQHRIKRLVEKQSPNQLIEKVDSDGYLFDIFLSYRVSPCLTPLAEQLFYMLKSQGVRVFWDKKCLKPGADWEKGFTNALFRSRCFVPLISRSSVQRMEKFDFQTRVDNYLSEMALALELAQVHRIRKIFPLLVGANRTLVLEDGKKLQAYADLFREDRFGQVVLPCEIPVAMNTKHSTIFKEFDFVAGPDYQKRTVKNIIDLVIKNQGSFLRGLERDRPVDKVFAELTKLSQVTSDHNSKHLEGSVACRLSDI